VLLAAFVFAIAAQSFAITYIVPPDRFEIERAGAIVVGRVLGSHVEASRYGIETVTTIALGEAIKGNPGSVVNVRTPGGTVDGETRLIPSVPTFVDGERVLLFLFQRDDAAYVISDLGLGTFRLLRDAIGRELAVRNDSDIEGWDAGGNVHVEQQRSAERFLDYVRGVVRGDVVAEDYVVAKMPSSVNAESLHPIATASFTATSYMLTYNSGLGTRWNVFPSAVSWNRGNSETGPLGNGAAEISAAFSTWNAGGTNYVLSSANANPNGFLDATDGTNNIVFEKNLTSAGLQPFSCSSGGALGIAGMTHASPGSHVYRGETFLTTAEADISMNQGVGTCSPGTVPQELFKSAITHEFGHTLGFRHSDQTRNLAASCAGDPTLDCTSSALMNHILASGLNGQLQAWDNAALNAVYGAAPACTPPSITLQPFGASINSGNSAQLSVAATGTAPLLYRYLNTRGRRNDVVDRRRSGDHDVVLGPHHGSMRTPREQQHRHGGCDRLRPSADPEHVEGSDGPLRDGLHAQHQCHRHKPVHLLVRERKPDRLRPNAGHRSANADHAIPRARREHLRLRRQQPGHDHRDGAAAADGPALIAAALHEFQIRFREVVAAAEKRLAGQSCCRVCHTVAEIQGSWMTALAESRELRRSLAANEARERSPSSARRGRQGPPRHAHGDDALPRFEREACGRGSRIRTSWPSRILERKAERGLRVLQRCDVDLLHLQHRVHDAAGLGAIGIGEEAWKSGGDDLPGHSEFVFEPRALLRVGIAAFRELVPVVIDLGLRLAADLKRDGCGEFELRSAVQRGEGLPFQFEGDGHRRPRLFAVNLFSGFAVAADVRDARVVENRNVEIRCLLALIIEPEAGSDLLFVEHGFSWSEVYQSRW
jgi:hypothetical protein